MSCRISAAIASLALTVSAAPGFGACPTNYQAQASFDPERYLGVWHEIYRDAYMWYEQGASCTTAEYTRLEDSSVEVYNAAKYWFVGWYGMKGNAAVSDRGDASLVVSFGNKPAPSDRANYEIISTDYDSYAIVYSCQNFYGGWFSNESFWILARETTLSETKLAELLKMVDEKLPSYDYKRFAEFTKTDADFCQYDQRKMMRPK